MASSFRRERLAAVFMADGQSVDGVQVLSSMLTRLTIAW
jgi:hypothetical protein